MKRKAMYGTVFTMNVKNGHKNQLIEAIGSDEYPEGMVCWFLLDPDNSEDVMTGIAVFKDKSTYIENANRPEQHQQYLRLLEHIEGEPMWTDGEIVQGGIAE
tara:strand:- start:993 stop:1298 length:306 start_codon:yes stop_codon:yes gene_type:complete